MRYISQILLKFIKSSSSSRSNETFVWSKNTKYYCVYAIPLSAWWSFGSRSQERRIPHSQYCSTRLLDHSRTVFNHFSTQGYPQRSHLLGEGSSRCVWVRRSLRGETRTCLPRNRTPFMPRSEVKRQRKYPGAGKYLSQRCPLEVKR